MSADAAAQSFRKAAFRLPRPGDREGFERLMARHVNFLRQIVREQADDRLRSVMTLEDLLRDVTIATYRWIGHRDFSTPASFRRWLAALVQQRLSYLERRHCGTLANDGKASSVDKRPGNDRHEPATTRACAGTPQPTRLELAEALERVLMRIPAKYREIIRLLHVERLSTREIAERLGTRPEAVGRLLTRALAACREAMPPRIIETRRARTGQ